MVRQLMLEQKPMLHGYYNTVTIQEMIVSEEI